MLYRSLGLPTKPTPIPRFIVRVALMWLAPMAALYLLTSDYVLALIWAALLTPGVILAVYFQIRLRKAPHPANHSRHPSPPWWAGAGVPPEHDPKEQPDTPAPFHVMGGVPWEGTVPTSTADKALAFTRRLFSSRRQRSRD